MANAVVDVIKMGDPLGGHEFSDALVVLRVFLCGGRNDMVEDDHQFLRTANLGDAKLLEFLDDSCGIVMGQDKIGRYSNHIPCFNLPPSFLAKDFF
jgi:hypothetical protein